MKKQMYVVLVMGVLLTGGFTAKNNVATDERTSLQDAEKTLLVKSTVTSNGKYTGECINLQLTNLKSKATKILVPAGTVFIADNSGEQNILMTQDLMVDLKPNESKWVNITGYCCEKDDAAPEEGSTFKTSKHEDEKIIKLLKFLKDKSYGNSEVQEAVWCVANGASVSSVYVEDETKQNALRKYICELTGQEDTWFTKRQERTIGANRMIESNPYKIEGTLSFTADRPMNVVKKIYNDKDSLLYTLGSGMNLPRAGYYEYEFNITVQGWEKGKYYVLVMGGTKQLKRQDFEI